MISGDAPSSVLRLDFDLRAITTCSTMSCDLVDYVSSPAIAIPITCGFISLIFDAFSPFFAFFRLLLFAIASHRRAIAIFVFVHFLRSVSIYGSSRSTQYSLSYVHFRDFCYFCLFLRYFCYWTILTICTYDLDRRTRLLRSYVPCDYALGALLCPLRPYLAIATLYTAFS